MKNNISQMKKNSIFICVAVMLIAGNFMLFGCKKPGDTFEAIETSNLRVVNALPGPSDVRFFVDSLKFTLTGTLDYGTISTPNYYVIKSGTRIAKFVANDVVFAQKDIQLDPKNCYTLFLAGTEGNPEYFFTKDNLTEAAADKAKIRLANLGIDLLTNIDVSIQLENILNPQPEVRIFNGIAKSTVTDYKSVSVPATKGNAVEQLHTIRVYEAGTNNLLAFEQAVDLRATTINTIIFRGINGGNPGLAIAGVREWLDW